MRSEAETTVDSGVHHNDVFCIALYYLLPFLCVPPPSDEIRKCFNQGAAAAVRGYDGDDDQAANC